MRWDDRNTPWDKIEKKENGCWSWGGFHNKDGYARFKIGGKTMFVHRFTFIAIKGEIKSGLELDHLCRNRWCVNPEHLEAVPHVVNVQRGLAVAPKKPHKRKGIKLVNPNDPRSKKKCSRGHAFAEYGYDRHDGKGRNCRKCCRERSLKSWNKKKNKVYEG